MSSARLKAAPEQVPREPRVPVRRSWWQRWPEWVAYAAAGWSLLYATLALYWSLGGAGFPFGAANDPPAATTSLLGGVRAGEAAPVIAGLGLAGTLVGFAMGRGWGRGLARVGLLGFAIAAAVALALLIPDYRVLVFVAYAPILLLGAPFGWPPETNILALLTWPVINQMVCIGGGVAWMAAAVAYRRKGRDACPYCGRSGDGTSWTTPAAAARWGRWATYIAVAVPIIYAATRWTWALGIPLGISEQFLREGQAIGLWWAGAALATVAVAGALLTLGLIQRWGEVFPSWLPLIGRKRVPPALVIVPAMFMAVLVTNAGLMYTRLILSGGFRLGEGTVLTLGRDWAAVAPELLWPIWGIALAAATIAYYYRRRGRCGYCGRGGREQARLTVSGSE